MKKIISVMVLLLIVAAMWRSCTKITQEPEKQMLFNGTDLAGWKLFVPGDSVDVNTVWSVVDGVVHCSGVPNGYMRTEESFENYKLHVEWRWIDEGFNSGVLLHCQGEDQVWPNCIECQLQSGSAGNFVLIGPGQITVDGEQYINTEVFLSISKKEEGIEKPLGEWNTYDIVADSNTVTCTVNGVLQNSGSEALISSGPIALQSEGGPIEFRNIYVEKL